MSGALDFERAELTLNVKLPLGLEVLLLSLIQIFYCSASVNANDYRFKIEPTCGLDRELTEELDEFSTDLFTRCFGFF